MDVQLFKTVVNNNLEMIVNKITTNAENYAMLSKTELLTEDETRQRAVDFTTLQVAQILADKLRNKV